MDEKDLLRWAIAISSRISDEWSGAAEFPEDARKIKELLLDALKKSPHMTLGFIGTGVIEETYFDELT